MEIHPAFASLQEPTKRILGCRRLYSQGRFATRTKTPPFRHRLAATYSKLISSENCVPQMIPISVFAHRNNLAGNRKCASYEPRGAPVASPSFLFEEWQLKTNLESLTSQGSLISWSGASSTYEPMPNIVKGFLGSWSFSMPRREGKSAITAQPCCAYNRAENLNARFYRQY